MDYASRILNWKSNWYNFGNEQMNPFLKLNDGFNDNKFVNLDVDSGTSKLGFGSQVIDTQKYSVPSLKVIFEISRSMKS